ncbi:hypothetical protein RsTz2092_04080 [Deferribacterales bacterium RsTz2092]
MLQQLQDRLNDSGVVVSVTISETADAVPVAKAVFAADVPVVQITSNSADIAKIAVTDIKKAMPDMIVGVLATNTLNIEEYIRAGADFVSTPDLKDEFRAFCAANDITIEQCYDGFDKDYAKITKLARNALMRVLGFEFLHLGVNTADEKGANSFADAMNNMFGLGRTREIEQAVFVGDCFEVMKHSEIGTKGHVGFTTNNVRRALAYLKRKGVGKVDLLYREENGIPLFAFLDVELAGYKFHIKQKGS